MMNGRHCNWIAGGGSNTMIGIVCSGGSGIWSSIWSWSGIGSDDIIGGIWWCGWIRRGNSVLVTSNSAQD